MYHALRSRSHLSRDLIRVQPFELGAGTYFGINTAREAACRRRGEGPQRQVDEALLYCTRAEEAAFDFSGREMKREESSIRFVTAQNNTTWRGAAERALSAVHLIKIPATDEACMDWEP